MEFIVLASFMLVAVLGFFAVMSSKILESREDGNKKIAEDISNFAYREIEMAKGFNNGYERYFTMPSTINGAGYTINVTADRELIVNYLGNEYVRFLPSNVTGNLSAGFNRIRKVDGVINLVATSPPPPPLPPLPPPPPSPEYYYAEAEALSLTSGYASASDCNCPSPSNGLCARHGGSMGSEGFVTLSSFPKGSGDYIIKVRYCDESDEPPGNADDYRILVNGAPVYSWSTSLANGANQWQTASVTAPIVSGNPVAIGAVCGQGNTYCRIDWVDFTPTTSPPPPPPPPSTSTSFSFIVSQSRDDAEVFISTNSVSYTSSDLELVHDASDQTVGLRFSALSIPTGAAIQNVQIEFTVDESSWTEATNLIFHGQCVSDAPTFSSSSADISSRTKTSASVQWSSIPAWTTVGAKVQTPNLAPIIQEIISTCGYAQGKSMAIIVTGTGHRTAEAYDSGSSVAPRLFGAYTT